MKGAKFPVAPCPTPKKIGEGRTSIAFDRENPRYATDNAGKERNGSVSTEQAIQVQRCRGGAGQNIGKSPNSDSR